MTQTAKMEVPAEDAVYGAQGITADTPVITSCRIDERSSHTWFVLKYLLGFENKNYGSWTERDNLVAARFARPGRATREKAERLALEKAGRYLGQTRRVTT